MINSFYSEKKSELLDTHNPIFFSEFKLLNDSEQSTNYESYDLILNKVFQASNSFLIHTDYSGIIVKSVFNSELNLFNKREINIGSKILDLFSRSTKEHIKKNIHSAINYKNVKTFDVLIEKRDCEHIFELSIIPLVVERELLFYFQQVTDKRKIEISLKKSDELLKSIWNNSFDGMRLTNKNGIVIAVNDAFCKMMGINPYELVGKHYKAIYVNDTRNCERIEIDTWENSGSKYYETVLRTINGKQLTVTVMSTLVKNVFSKNISKSPNQYLLLSVFRDLTERIRNENKIREAEKLSIFGKMSAYLAHQIKTPLATIKMNLNLLEKSKLLATKNVRSFNIINDEIDRLNKLIQNAFILLRKSNNVEINITSHDLINSIGEFYELLLREKGIKFLNETSCDIFYEDYQKLRMVLILLIENSIEAINGSGYIKIINEKNIDDKTYSIYIEDSGEGIIEPSSIFEIFYTTKSYGTGLGLSIVKSLLSEMNGSIGLISARKGKTIFKVTLPFKVYSDG